MKNKILRVTLLCILLSSTSGIFSQVTIGSTIKPEQGALLDLKQLDDAAAKAGGSTSVMGLGLPRVKLKYLTVQPSESLAQTVDGNPSSEVWDSDSHAGLVVYNVSGERNCGPIPDGIYVWDGQKWVGLFDKVEVAPATLSITGDREYYVPSGLGLEELPSATAPSFTLNWSPAGMPARYSNTADASWGGVTFSGTNAPSGEEGTLTTSPATIVLSADAMTAADIASNPFRTKLSTLTFRATDECGGGEITEVVTVNQTNKTLIIGEPYRQFLTSPTGSITNTLSTNTNWKLKSIFPATNNAISNVKVGTPAQSIAIPSTVQEGFERDDNTGLSTTLTYNVGTGPAYALYNILTFEDASGIKRFPDVTLTVAQCINNQAYTSQQPSIEMWAIIGGFSQAEIDEVKSTGENSRVLPNGMQMHRIKKSARGDNQIFLSSLFFSSETNSEQRWMIHNLDATAYDNVSDAPTLINALNLVGDSYKGANYIYAKNNASAFANNERLGLMYNWKAATANKVSVSTDIGQGKAGQYQSVQGICPVGWHVPTDREWTTLERSIVLNKSLFSTLATSVNPTLNYELNGGNNIVGVDYLHSSQDDRGLDDDLKGHGNAMMELCEISDYPTVKPASNVISSTQRPGFGVLYTGWVGPEYYSPTLYADFDIGLVQIWSSSSSARSQDGLFDIVWTRSFDSEYSSVYRGNAPIQAYANVRCIKD